MPRLLLLDAVAVSALNVDVAGSTDSVAQSVSVLTDRTVDKTT